jgi:putative endonuclease
MVRCSDDSFYVGSTSYADVKARVTEHNDAKYIGYTASRRPVVLVWARRFDDLRDAHDTERRLKGWSRNKKAALIADDGNALHSLSRRRGGNPKPQQRPLTVREAADLAQGTGAESRLSTMRSAPLLSKQADARHPEVRAKRAPKDIR